MQQYSGALMHTLGTWAGWEQMHSGALIQGLTPSHTHCTEVEEARVCLIRTEAQLFVHYPLLLIWPHRSVPSVGFYAPSCPLCFRRGSHTKTAWPHRHLGELSLTRKPPPNPPTILKLSALGHHSPTAATLQKPGVRQGTDLGAPVPLCHTPGPATEDMRTCSSMPQWCPIFVFIHATWF